IPDRHIRAPRLLVQPRPLHQLPRPAPALDHEVLHHPMERGPVVRPAIGVAQEVGHCDRRLPAVQLEHDFAHARVHAHAHRPALRRPGPPRPRSPFPPDPLFRNPPTHQPYISCIMLPHPPPGVPHVYFLSPILSPGRWTARPLRAMVIWYLAPVPAPITPRLQLRRLFLRAAIASLAIGGLIAVAALLLNQFNETTRRILGTLVALAFHCGIAIVLLHNMDKGRAIALMRACLALFALSFAALMLAIWALRDRYIVHAVGSTLALTGACILTLPGGSILSRPGAPRALGWAAVGLPA